MKHWPFLLGGFATLIIIVLVGFFVLSPKGSKNSQQNLGEPQEVSPPEISLRPFFSFAPRGDGKAIQISVAGIGQGSQIDYEITYKTAAGLEQGIGGPVALEAGQTFYSREHIFGTCSKNVCTYDKGVENGSWRATIEKGTEFYQLEGAWRLQNIGKAGGKVGLADKFELTIDSNSLSKSQFIITSENVSIPKKLPEGSKLILGPFTIVSSEQLNFKKPVQVSFSVVFATNVQILQIGPTAEWQALESNFDSSKNTTTANTSTAGTFILVEKL